jgi:hypothetical protein
MAKVDGTSELIVLMIRTPFYQRIANVMQPRKNPPDCSGGFSVFGKLQHQTL